MMICFRWDWHDNAKFNSSTYFVMPNIRYDKECGVDMQFDVAIFEAPAVLACRIVGRLKKRAAKIESRGLRFNKFLDLTRRIVYFGRIDEG